MNDDFILTNTEIVLVRAENPMNIGQCARAMRNFGLSTLSLVNCGPHQVSDAYTTGWRGKNILDEAVVYPDLKSALEGTSLVIGFTTRSGRHRGEPRSVLSLAPQILEQAASGRVALLFGNESHGLSNEELAVCHELAMIPASADYSSLNLAHAVAIAGFSLFSRLPEALESLRKPERHYATAEEMDELMVRFSRLLADLEYEDIRKGLHGKTVENLRRYFQRTWLEKRELQLFSALLANMGKRIKAEKMSASILGES